MALGTIAAVLGGLAAAGSLANLGYQASKGDPSQPNLASSSKQVAEANASALPWQRMLAAYEQLGKAPKTTSSKQTLTQLNKTLSGLKSKLNKAPNHTDTGIQAQIDVINGQIKAAKDSIHQGAAANYNGPSVETLLNKNLPRRPGESDSSYNARANASAAHGLTPMQAAQNQYNKGLAAYEAQQGKTATFDVFSDDSGNIVDPSIAQGAFEGYGTADVEGKLAQQFADIQQQLGEKYGTQYADLARQNAELADPLGTQARAMEQQLIQKQLDQAGNVNPLSTSLESGIDAQLKAGSGFDPEAQAALEAAVSRAAADRGGTGPSSSDVAGELSQGASGAARRQAAIDKSQAWLSSGQTPEDIAYRRRQQGLANEGSFVAGTSPVAQFGALANAGRGAAPGPTAANLPNANISGNLGAANQAALGNWSANVNAQANQANPYMAAFGGLLNLGAAVNQWH